MYVFFLQNITTHSSCESISQFSFYCHFSQQRAKPPKGQKTDRDNQTECWKYLPSRFFKFFLKFLIF